MDTYTRNIDSALQIRKADNIYRLSVKANGGSVTIRGNIPSFTFTEGGELPSTDVTLFDGQSGVYNAAVMAGMELLITPVGGTADIEIFLGAN